MNEKTIYNFLTKNGLSHTGAAALMGNLYAESGLNPTNLENYYERQLGTTDAKYTANVDSGKYTAFDCDSAGYGLAQWTYKTRKRALLQYSQKKKCSIGNLDMQLEFLLNELKNSYPGVLSVLKNQNVSLREASDIVMCQFENPADKSETAKARRAEYGMSYYSMFVNSTATSYKTIKKGDSGNEVKELQERLASCGYLRSSEIDGSFGKITLGALLAFQLENGLDVDGICGSKTWEKLSK